VLKIFLMTFLGSFQTSYRKTTSQRALSTWSTWFCLCVKTEQISTKSLEKCYRTFFWRWWTYKLKKTVRLSKRHSQLWIWWLALWQTLSKPRPPPQKCLISFFASDIESRVWIRWAAFNSMQMTSILLNVFFRYLKTIRTTKIWFSLPFRLSWFQSFLCNTQRAMPSSPRSLWAS